MQRERWVPYEQPVENDANGGLRQQQKQSTERPFRSPYALRKQRDVRSDGLLDPPC